MDGYYFISYSSVDGEDWASRLRDAFVAGGTKAWLDRFEIRPGSKWADEIDDALKGCTAVFFVMTPDSVHRTSETRKELDRARKYKKPIIPLRFDQDALIPYSLEGYQEIDFVRDFSEGLAALRNHCRWLAGPEGEVYKLKCRIQDAERELPRERDERKKLQIRTDLEYLRERLEGAEQALRDPGQAFRDVRDRIDQGIRREQGAAQPAPKDKVVAVVNRRPASPPSNFQNRTAETQLMARFLEDASKRLLLVVGRAGVGKTAMVCRMLYEIEHGRFPGDHDLRVNIGGIVYMGGGPARDISFANLFADLCHLLPADQRKGLERLWTESKEIQPRAFAVCSAFVGDPVVVLLDNFEDFIDSSTQNISDKELDEVLRNLLALPDHSIKVIITTQVTPRALALYQPGRQTPLNLNEGLDSPYAEELLRLMDGDGKVGLRDATPDILNEIRRRTQGIPRALEAFYAILSADRYTTVSDVLADAGRILPDNVVEQLVAQAYHRLDAAAQRVFQALAIYGQPVIGEAVDFLLQPFGPASPSEPVLRRLVGMFLVRHDARHFFLHPVDAAFALTQIPEGGKEDWHVDQPVFTRTCLFYRGATYFRKIRRAEDTWQSIEDLDPVLAEFNLLLAAGDHETALKVLDTMLPYLDRWGHTRQMARLGARLARDASQPVRCVAAGLTGRALFALGEIPAAIDYLHSALEVPPEEIDISALLDWRLVLGDCHSALGDYDAAEMDYREVLEQAPEHDVDTQAAAFLGLGSVAEARSRFDEAEEHYRQGLTIYVPQLSVGVDSEGEKTVLVNGTLPPGLPLENASSWHSLSVAAHDSATARDEVVPLYGIEVPPDPTSVSSPAETAAGTEEGERPALEVALVRPTPQLAEIWMSFAGLYARTDRLGEAAACCRLGGSIYEDMQNDFGAARALDLMRRVAGQLPDADAEEVIKAQEQELQRARDSGDRRLEIKILKDLADSYLEQYKFTDAETIYKDLHRRGVELEDPSLLVDAEIGLARLDWLHEKSDAAISRLEKLCEHRQQDLMLQTDIDLLLGRIELSRHRRESALKYLRKASRGYSILGSLSQQIEVDRLLADIAIDTRDYDGAVRKLQGAVELARAVRIKSLLTSVLCALARAHVSAGQREAALARIEEAAETAREIELPYTQAESLMTIGGIRAELKDFDTAEKAYHEAHEIYQRTRNLDGQVRSFSGLSRLYYLAGKFDSALKAAHDAWQLISSLDDPAAVRDARMELATAMSECGFHAEAIQHLQAIVDEKPSALYVGNLGWVLYAAGEYARSLEQSRRALELDSAAAWVIRNLAHAYLASGRPDDAEREYKRAIQIRKGGEDFFETIRVVRKLLSEKPDLPKGREMLQMLEEEQRAIDSENR